MQKNKDFQIELTKLKMKVRFADTITSPCNKLNPDNRLSVAVCAVNVRNDICVSKVFFVCFQTPGAKTISQTSEEDGFDLWDHNRGLEKSK